MAALADLVVVTRDTNEFVAAGAPVFDPWDSALYVGDKVLQLPDADGPDALAKAKALMGV